MRFHSILNFVTKGLLEGTEDWRLLDVNGMLNLHRMTYRYPLDEGYYLGQRVSSINLAILHQTRKLTPQITLPANETICGA